jgi:hypothetical protein
MSNAFGLTTVKSTSKTINFIATNSSELSPVVGKMVYLDFGVGGELYRSIGTVTDVTTENTMFSPGYESVMARTTDNFHHDGQDLRRSSFIIQATFRKNKEGFWEKHSSSLPTSPSTNVQVNLLTEEIANEMVSSATYPTIGYFRGMENVAQPLMVPDFGDSVGAKSSGILGRSGSGKSSMYTMILGNYMKHEHHAILVIDPQGQWSNENGMIFSPQNFAKSLGREVNVLRVSEDIKLPMDVDIFTRMLNKIGLWKKFRRMGGDNLESFSDAVATRIAKSRDFDAEPRDLLSKVFADIANSPSVMSRIYAKGDRRDDFRRELLILAGEPVIDLITEEEEVLTAGEIEDNEANWENILSLFTPLQNLFSSSNFTGGVRRPLGGPRGFLSDVFKVRQKTDAPAPYVVFDMSPSTELHAKNELTQGSDVNLYMQKILDDQDVKALILMMVLAEMKKASEIAFATGSGNLNTQIVFDEAWRFAPEGKATPEIEELANQLEGFALDTRKFGIGWTYILQSPADLKFGIWKQLTYVYAGHGLVGDDVKRLESLTDDPKQLDLYRQFIPPASTGVYPFMILGPISPIIFTTSPAFINIFSGSKEFLEHNSRWIDEIINRRSLVPITELALTSPLKKKDKLKSADVKVFKVGRDENSDHKRSVPQTKVVPRPVIAPKPVANEPVFATDEDYDDAPF